jgi:hypothetical protein
MEKPDKQYSTPEGALTFNEVNQLPVGALLRVGHVGKWGRHPLIVILQAEGQVLSFLAGKRARTANRDNHRISNPLSNRPGNHPNVSLKWLEWGLYRIA